MKKEEIALNEKDRALCALLKADIESVSPETTVHMHLVLVADPWDFESVWDVLYGWAVKTAVDPERDNLLVNLNTGTYVAQIVLFLLVESRHLPGRMLQLSPGKRAADIARGTYRTIALDLSRYDRIATRLHTEHMEGQAFLKAGIATRNAAFNRLIERIEQVAGITTKPILLTGPTGAGKTQLARRIFDLKQGRHQISGAFVQVNCATLRGDQAMAALFGHTRGAFTGAAQARPGLLREADGGLLFLDEIGELGLDEQAMLLHAIENRRFLPVGSDREVASKFQLIAGSNRDLRSEARAGRFRADLLARIDLWAFSLPGLTERREDIAPNLDHELDAFARENGRRVSMNREARTRFLRFAEGADARWSGNFRDLNAAVTRMGTLAQGGRIAKADVDEEISRLSESWGPAEDVRTEAADADARLVELMGKEGPGSVAELDRFDRVQLADVVAVCQRSPSLSAAGRKLFAASRARRASKNDSDRLRKYLSKFGLTFAKVTGE